MYATYTLTKDELNFEFIENLKKLITGNQVQLSIESYDETEYLMRLPKNREFLLKAIDNVENGGKLITVPIEEIERLINETNNI